MNNNINSLSIKNYKNLRDFKVDSLSRVNLIVGKNNSGKSTLLEAISIYAAKGNINQLTKILKMRGISVSYNNEDTDLEEKNIEILSTLYTNSAKDNFFINPIEIAINEDIKKLLSIKFVKTIRETTIDELGLRTSKARELKKDEEIISDSDIIVLLYSEILDSFKSVSGLKHNIFRNIEVEQKIPCVYVRTGEISSKNNSKYYDKIALSKLEAELVEALNIIEPEISAINFLNETNQAEFSKTRIPIVTLKDDDGKRHRLSTMGDGTNRILTIILAMLNCKDGIFLIDEFDNGLHYSVQTKLWEMVYSLAEKLNIQVFATTHSNDCIKSFIDAGKEQKETPSLIRLEKREDNVVAVSYNKESLLRYILTSDAEVR